MTDIRIERINDVYAQVRAEPGIIMELREFFTFKVPGAQFSPAYKNKYWDGKIVLMSQFGQIYAGLISHVQEFAKSREYECRVDIKEGVQYSEAAVDEFIKKLMLPANKQPYDYQKTALMVAINDMRALLISPTASGKSLIIYMILSWFDQVPFMVVVPTKSLVMQLRSDFIEYGMDEEEIAILMGGENKNPKNRVVITTWQSAALQPKAWFQKYGGIIGDEAHLFKAKSLEKIMQSLTNCPIRIGTTGTLDGTKVNKLVLEGLFGPVYQVERTDSLIAQGRLSALRVRCVVLEYPEHERKTAGRDYQDELDFITSHQRRNELIRDLALTLKGNTLILYAWVDKHGKPIYDLIARAAPPGRKVFFIHGGTDAKDRETIRHIVEKEKDAIIVASYGVFSTGVNIRNLHNAVAASPSKSVVRVLQSIGRILRLGDDKEYATWYDFADDITWKSKTNHTLKHFGERMRIYDEQNFDVKVFRRKV